MSSVNKAPTIFIAPLDWGLGHSTRSIPVINQFLAQGTKVILGGGATAKKIFSEVFPNLPFEPLPDYNIRYSSSACSLLPLLASQIPQAMSVMKKENEILHHLIAKHRIDAIISDNRPGLHTKLVPSIYITHQLQIESGFYWLNSLAQQKHYKIINKFSECWVPDFEGENNLAGQLSHPKKPPKVPIKYIGSLSRFQQKNTKPNGHMLILLSGPEPQRTIFENKILAQAKNIREKIIVVRGLPLGQNPLTDLPENITVHHHLPAGELSELMESASQIIARGGYSTIMDLVSLQKSALLVPTPGQGEQEYLCRQLADKGYFSTMEQKDFDLKQAINHTNNHQLFVLPSHIILEDVISKFINGLK